MVTFSFIQYGENLGTRPLGQRVRESLLPMIEQNDLVVLDFTSVNVVSNSFANECIAKNYLNSLELEDMGRLVNAVLDMAERMAKRHIPMTMEDWAQRIDLILEAGGDSVIDNAGQISAEFAKQFAESEFEKYRIIQDRLFESDFDRFNHNLLEFPDDIQ